MRILWVYVIIVIHYQQISNLDCDILDYNIM
jgi:hypothetical protein